MPQINRFKKNTVLYLTGESPEHIYLVKEGKVVLSPPVSSISRDSSSEDVKLKGKEQKVINKGEFFGLFSSLGAYPRQEDAVAYSDVELVMFNEKEFEELVGKTPKLSLQLMRMLSKELRVIHKSTREILSNDKIVLKDEGLYGYIEMYDKHKDKDKVIYVATQFLKQHPTSKYVAKVQEILDVYQG